jgi:Putative peptidoglycan binding domain
MPQPEPSPSTSVSPAGFVATDQPGAGPEPILAGPATARQFNTIGERLIPKACFRMEDIRFEFDSSFIRPEVKDDLPALAALIEKHTLSLGASPEQNVPPPLSIFGHADPVGNDDYNKHLSGRRALAVYALLVRDADLWEELFTKPAGGDDWGNKALQTMLSALGHSPGPVDGVMGEKSKAALKSFQAEHGLAADGVAGSQTRKALYRAYMDFLCGPRLKLDKEKNFLARNRDGDGLKGEVQGCSEFNPVRMFSEQEHTRFEQAQDKAERNDENAPNRRVMILLYAPGRRVNPQFWPCPRVKEGVADCKKRFFPDADQRRSFQAQRRDFDQTRNTFACRFYQLISGDSPCERFLMSFQIRLYAPSGQFIAFAPYELSVGSTAPRRGRADGRGIVTAQDVEVPARCQIKWGFPPASKAAPELSFSQEMFLRPDKQLKPEEATQKLHNLGYSRDDELKTNTAAFQRDYGHLADPPLDANGELNDNTVKLLRAVYESCEDDLRNTQPTKKPTGNKDH